MRRWRRVAHQLIELVLVETRLLERLAPAPVRQHQRRRGAHIVMHKAARAIAALDGRLRVTPDDVRTAATLVLPHRRRRKPFEQPGLDENKLDELMRDAAPPPPQTPPSPWGLSALPIPRPRSTSQQIGRAHV